MHIRAQINHAYRHMTINPAKLRSLGYKQLGQGAFSRAFYHPDAPDVVVKIGSRRSRVNRCRHLRDAFPDFAKAIIRGEIRSKFFPKIYAIMEDGDHFCCVMRRYQKFTGRNTKRSITATASKLNRGWVHGTPNVRRFGRAIEALLTQWTTLDICGPNIMQDSNGTPILTDPVCYS
ncbi:hypothetical protein [Mesorhizobium sp. WSM2239]|uniref:Protein kinase domain-containing protein n=2 Tax=unclassified Mesorhizobium TaxID=325217 RepID=A0AAU8DFI4_9HYPH